MNKELANKYNDFVNNNLIKYDQKQFDLLQGISKVWEQYKKIIFFNKQKKEYGVYVNGSVGIGKTFILNLFVQQRQRGKKIHFNHFMINLHAFVNNQKNNKEKTLEMYIKNISKKYDLIFIDELHIFNIVDALLIKNVFVLFKKYKMFVLTSSNFEPDDLYKNGLQRDDFLPFIKFVKENFAIFSINQIQDYRRKMRNQSKTYFTPINTNTTNEFNNLFDRFVDKGQIHVRQIKTNSRIIRFDKSTSNIVYCQFKFLCEKNLAHEDYLNISKAFSLIFISSIPQFTNSEFDQCRRFISLIDMLYENKCSVVILAEKPINKLCLITNLNKEFERTVSRLYEMTIIDSKIK